MAGRILVAYATRNGSTAEIGQAVGKELVAAGYNVDVMGLKMVNSLVGYDAVVLGAPIYMGNVVTEMGSFVRRHLSALVSVPVAVFAVGLAPKNPNPKQMEEAGVALRMAVAPLTPVAEIIFAGRLNPERLTFFQRKITELVKSPVGDFRDWDAIAAWAKALPAHLGIR